MWLNALAVALGGALGALARYGVYALLVPPRDRPHHGLLHPVWATCFVNLAGCLLLGLFLGWFHKRGPADDRLRALITTGFLGAFTTFSTFAGDVVRLTHEHKPWPTVAYILTSVGMGIALCFAGFSMGKGAAGWLAAPTP